MKIKLVGNQVFFVEKVNKMNETMQASAGQLEFRVGGMIVNQVAGPVNFGNNYDQNTRSILVSIDCDSIFTEIDESCACNAQSRLN